MHVMKKSERKQREFAVLFKRDLISIISKTKILYSSATELVTMLNDRKTTSVDILLLLAERAYTIGLDNCLITEDNFDDALKTAEESDRHRH
jgi:hypothetical protein